MDYRYRMSQKELEYTYEHAQRRMKEHPRFAEEHKAVIEKHPFFNSEKEALEKVLELNKEKHSNYQIWAKIEKGKDNIYRIQSWWLVTDDGKIKMSAEYIGMALMYDDVRLSEIYHSNVKIDDVIAYH